HARGRPGVRLPCLPDQAIYGAIADRAHRARGGGCSVRRAPAHSSIFCSNVCAGVPLRTAANFSSGTEVVTASMLASTASTVKLLPPSISRSSAEGAASPAMQVLVRHQVKGILWAAPLSTVSLTPGGT